MKKGFTLIEILVVIGIIVMLATIGLGVFSGARRNLTLDLETDKLIAVLQSLRTASQTQCLCVGLRFERNKSPQKITTSYRNRVQKCDPNETREAFSWPKEIALADLALDETSRDNLEILFIPPQGNLQFKPAGESAQLTLAITSPTMISKKILLHAPTGRIEKK